MGSSTVSWGHCGFCLWSRSPGVGLGRRPPPSEVHTQAVRVSFPAEGQGTEDPALVWPWGSVFWPLTGVPASCSGPGFQSCDGHLGRSSDSSRDRVLSTHLVSQVEFQLKLGTRWKLHGYTCSALAVLGVGRANWQVGDLALSLSLCLCLSSQ